jgi:hypothetical protein
VNEQRDVMDCADFTAAIGMNEVLEYRVRRLPCASLAISAVAVHLTTHAVFATAKASVFIEVLIDADYFNKPLCVLSLDFASCRATVALLR